MLLKWDANLNPLAVKPAEPQSLTRALCALTLHHDA
jgi:hypothetical protein